MFRMKGDQIKRLRVVLQVVYQGANAADRFGQFLLEQLDVNLSDLTSEKVEFSLQLFEVLAKLNSADKAPQLLDKLEQEHSEASVLLQVIAQLRQEAGPVLGNTEVQNRLRALETGYLLLDGLPFINRSRLREMLISLFDATNPARVGIVAGAELAGKSWSHHLIRAYCKTVQQPKIKRIFLDLEILQPGNDPRIVWIDLMKQLLYPQAPPEPPTEDTKGGQYVQRLVYAVTTAWEAREFSDSDEKPWLLIVFDHLEKNAAPAVGPRVIDFAEALAMAAVERRLEGGRVLLLGFPRRPAALSAEVIAPREDISSLTLAEVKKYLGEVGVAVGRSPPPQTAIEVESALLEADAKSSLEERRVALSALSATIGHHVSALVKA